MYNININHFKNNFNNKKINKLYFIYTIIKFLYLNNTKIFNYTKIICEIKENQILFFLDTLNNIIYINIL